MYKVEQDWVRSATTGQSEHGRGRTAEEECSLENMIGYVMLRQGRTEK